MIWRMRATLNSRRSSVSTCLLWMYPSTDRGEIQKGANTSWRQILKPGGLSNEINTSMRKSRRLWRNHWYCLPQTMISSLFRKQWMPIKKNSSVWTLNIGLIAVYYGNLGPEQHHHPEWHGIKDMDTAPVLVAAASGPREILILIPLGRVKWIRGRTSKTFRLILWRATRSLAFGHYGHIYFGLNFLDELDVVLYYY